MLRTSLVLATLIFLAGCNETDTVSESAGADLGDSEMREGAPIAHGAESSAAAREALDEIMTASGDSALKRMERCGMTIHWQWSWIDDEYVPDGRGGMNLAGRNLDIYFDAAAESDGVQPKEVLARWVFRNGEVTPVSGWARLIQNKAPPLRSPHYLNC